MYQLGGCGKTFVEGFGLVALEVLAWWLWNCHGLPWSSGSKVQLEHWVEGAAGTGKTLDRRTSRKWKNTGSGNVCLFLLHGVADAFPESEIPSQDMAGMSESTSSA